MYTFKIFIKSALVFAALSMTQVISGQISAIELNQEYLVEVDEDIVNQGGQILVNEETGLSYFRLEPDANGTGGYLSIKDGGSNEAFVLDANYNGTGFPSMSLQGPNSSFFRTTEFNDNSVVLPINAISSPEIQNESGLTSKTNFSQPLTSAYSTIATQTIVAPSAGYVMAIATAQVQISHTFNSVSSGTIGISNDPTTLNGVQDIGLSVATNATSGFYTQASTVHGIFQVNSGINQFYFIGNSVNANITCFDNLLSLIFIPTSYGTVETSINGTDVPDSKRDTESALDPKSIAEKSRLDNQQRIEREISELKVLTQELQAKINNNN